jgi:hypothetical protein
MEGNGYEINAYIPVAANLQVAGIAERQDVE